MITDWFEVKAAKNNHPFRVDLDWNLWFEIHLIGEWCDEQGISAVVDSTNLRLYFKTNGDRALFQMRWS